MATPANIPLPSPGYLANSRWIEANYGALVADYPDQWIAVDRGRVLASGANRGEVVARARQSAASDALVCEFIATSSMIF